MTAATRSLTTAEVDEFHHASLTWFDANARELPWRGDVSSWHVMVAEFMLQQTPVARVVPVFEKWMDRWPCAADLAADSAGEAVRAWGRLGYPRRALRLHAAAAQIVERHDGEVPRDIEALRALPGVGDYTSAAIASFAYEQSHAVLDTNVRRVFARVVEGKKFPMASLTAAERRLGEALVPERRADRWAIAVMELGALVCTSAAPSCQECPVRRVCRWRAGGYADHVGPARRTQSWVGTDRQCRGRLLAALRDSTGPLGKDRLAGTWPEDDQRERALESLITDGLVELVGDDSFSLPR